VAHTEGGWFGLSGKGANGVVKALFDTNILIDYLRYLHCAASG
jgi:hypothetical protein